MPISLFIEIQRKNDLDSERVEGCPSPAGSSTRGRPDFRENSRWVSLTLSHLTSREFRGSEIARTSSSAALRRRRADEPPGVRVVAEQDELGVRDDLPDLAEKVAGDVVVVLDQVDAVFELLEDEERERRVSFFCFQDSAKKAKDIRHARDPAPVSARPLSGAIRCIMEFSRAIILKIRVEKYGRLPRQAGAGPPGGKARPHCVLFIADLFILRRSGRRGKSSQDKPSRSKG